MPAKEQLVFQNIVHYYGKSALAVVVEVTGFVS